MKIIVIGNSARIRKEIVQRLREEGHEATTPSRALPRAHVGARTIAPRDPGHAGRHLRRLLEGASRAVADLWRASRAGEVPGLGARVWPIGRREDRSP